MLSTAISATLDAIPFVRGVWRRLMERGMQIDVTPVGSYVVHYIADQGPILLLGRFNIRLINHRTDRPERVIGARAHLKRRALGFWRKTMVSVPVSIDQGVSRIEIKDIELPAMSRPYEAQWVFDEAVDDPRLPKRGEIVLVLEMVGPVRRVERQITRVKHGA